MNLLESLPRLYQETLFGEVALGAAVKGALAGLVSLPLLILIALSHTFFPQSGCGGQVCVFLSSLPNWGPGALKSREDPLLYGTDKEKSLYSPVIPFWRNTAEELAESGVGVNIFLFPERYIDAASVGKSLKREKPWVVKLTSHIRRRSVDRNGRKRVLPPTIRCSERSFPSKR